MEDEISTFRIANWVINKRFQAVPLITYSLKRTKAIKLQNGDNRRPRLLIISREKSRSFKNVDGICKKARSLSYNEMKVEANLSTNLSKFPQVVNSFDVLMRVQGAELTNMVLLPDNAILIQILRIGIIDQLAKDDSGGPFEDMNIRYLEYKMKVKESSLIQQHPFDHVVFRVECSQFHLPAELNNFVYRVFSYWEKQIKSEDKV